jgi:hypothetical protein
MQPDHACAHDWQPIDGWYARYRCTVCHVLGCKFGVVVGPHGGHRSFEIKPYRCEAVRGGVKCNAPAVHGWRGKKFRCAEHRHGAHAARARRQDSVGSAAEVPAVVATDQPATVPGVEAPTSAESTGLHGPNAS